MYRIHVLVGETQVKPRKPPRPKQKGGSSLKVSIGRSRLSEPSSPPGSMMTVQVPRSKLKGSLGHGHQRSSLNPMYPAVQSDIPYNVLGNGEWVKQVCCANFEAREWEVIRGTNRITTRRKENIFPYKICRVKVPPDLSPSSPSPSLNYTLALTFTLHSQLQ